MLNEFRTDVTLNQIYRGRREYERVRAAELGEMEDTKAERDAAVAENARLAAALAEKDAVLAAAIAEKDAEISALRARLGPTSA